MRSFMNWKLNTHWSVVSMYWMRYNVIFYHINSLWPSDTELNHRFRSTLVQLMACCLMAQSHCLNQCWLLISEVLWHSPESNFTVSAQASYLYNQLENYIYKITATFPTAQWVNEIQLWLLTLVDIQLKDVCMIFWHFTIKPKWVLHICLSVCFCLAFCMFCTFILTLWHKFLLWLINDDMLNIHSRMMN